MAKESDVTVVMYVGDQTWNPRNLRPGMKLEWLEKTGQLSRVPFRWVGRWVGWDIDAQVCAVGVRILALPAPAALLAPVACWNCKHPRVTGFACPKCLQFEATAPPPPRCAPGCTPARACRGTACPVHYEPEEYGDDSLLWASSQLTTENLRLSPVDPPRPAREPRIGALSWGAGATACGGLSTRRGR